MVAWAGLGLLAACVLIGVLVTWVGAPPFDLWLTEHLDSWRSGPAGDVFVAATRVGYTTWLGPICAVLALVLGLARRSFRAGLLVLAATPVAALVTLLLKRWFDRPRPNLAQFEPTHGFSMPSGHAASSMAFAMSLVLAVPAGRPRRWTMAIAGLFTGIVGLSRVVLGVHWTSDVIAGWCEGAGVALLLAFVLGWGLPRDTAPDIR